MFFSGSINYFCIIFALYISLYLSKTFSASKRSTNAQFYAQGKGILNVVKWDPAKYLFISRRAVTNRISPSWDTVSSNSHFKFGKKAFTSFNPLLNCIADFSKYGSARIHAEGNFKEIDCGNEEILSNTTLQIPYDELQVAIFEGHEVLSEVLDSLKPVLHDACEKVLHKHCSRLHGVVGIDSGKDLKNALRSIRCLLYWIGGRILSAGKSAMEKLESQVDVITKDCLYERKMCDGLIRAFVSEEEAYWSAMLTHGNDIHSISAFPEFRGCNSPEEYIGGIWDYFNKNAFNNMLPDFWEIEFHWFEFFTLDLNELDGEVFNMINEDFLDLPSIRYPKELMECPSALANCVFRSMAKLFCVIYSPGFDSTDYCQTIINAFQFVESEKAFNDGINFTVIQKNFEEVSRDDPNLIAIYNASAKERDLYPGFDQGKKQSLGPIYAPLIKNMFDLELIRNLANKIEIRSILNLYDESFRLDREGITNRSETYDLKYENAWRRNGAGDLEIPLCELRRALLYGNFEDFGGIISIGMKEMLKLRPIQMNFIQNSIVNACLGTVDYLRSLEAYKENYSLFSEEDESHINKSIEKLSIATIQSLLIVYKVYEKCIMNNGLLPLGSDFLRRRPLEMLINTDKICEDGTNSDCLSKSMIRTLKKENEYSPIPFPEQYTNDAVAADDHLALRFLVNYYNFNLFGGRLPIDIAVKFDCDADCGYISSNDATRSILRVPTIYINPMFKNKKVLVARLILDECYNICMKWVNLFKFDIKGNEVTLQNLLESNLERRLKRHILNCIEESSNWPFHFDDLQYMAPRYLPSLEKLENGDKTNLTGPSLNGIFRGILNIDCDVLDVMENLVKRQEITDLWNKKILPIRHFVSSLQSGIYDLTYAIIVNPSSIKATSHLSMNEINIIENKFKEACEISFKMDFEEYDHLEEEEEDIKNALFLYLESLKIVECAFDELREQAVKHNLIISEDLIFGITKATNDLATTEDASGALCTDIKCKIIASDDHDKVKTPQNTKDSNSLADFWPKNTESVAIEDSSIGTETNDHKILAGDKQTIVNTLYKVYNEKIFANSLPKDFLIEFVTDLEDLSGIRKSLSGFEPPVILLNSVISDVQILHLQLVIQMINLQYFSTSHNIEFDSNKYFNIKFVSSFKMYHISKMNFFKRRMLPVTREAREARLKAIRTKNLGHNKPYMDSVGDSAKFQKNSEDKSLADMEIDEFVDEVLCGREKLRGNNGAQFLCNSLDEYKILKTFAEHFIRWKRAKMSSGSLYSHRSTDTSLDSGEDALNIYEPRLFERMWVKKRFELIQNVFGDHGIKLPFASYYDCDWHSFLSCEQQEKVIKYIAIRGDENDNMFTILTKSGACSQESAFEIFTRILQPLATQVEDETEKVSTHQYYDSKAYNHGEITDSEDQDIHKDNLLGNEFAVKLENIIGKMDEYNAEITNALIDKLVNRNFSDARSILSSCESPSYIIEVAKEILDVTRENKIIGKKLHKEILKFLES